MDPSPSTSSASSSPNKKLMGANKKQKYGVVQQLENIREVYSYLLTTSPTSVEAERPFAPADIFSTKLQSRVSDSSIDTIELY
jgi:hypothetical protein